MKSILVCPIIFYYIALLLIMGMFFVTHYTSELYLFNIAQNVGFLKLFYGL